MHTGADVVPAQRCVTGVGTRCPNRWLPRFSQCRLRSTANSRDGERRGSWRGDPCRVAQDLQEPDGAAPGLSAAPSARAARRSLTGGTPVPGPQRRLHAANANEYRLEVLVQDRASGRWARADDDPRPSAHGRFLGDQRRRECESHDINVKSPPAPEFRARWGLSRAETRGFEPLVPLRGLHLSRVVHSTGLCDVSSRCACANATAIITRGCRG